MKYEDIETLVKKNIRKDENFFQYLIYLMSSII